MFICSDVPAPAAQVRHLLANSTVSEATVTTVFIGARPAHVDTSKVARQARVFWILQENRKRGANVIAVLVIGASK
ncbi:hypothetical protein Mycsm_03609 [Mycobacterium sp. JS623]|nr:hypothetical protein Mycsm_03609 [Mycobacterium sp. JS623]